MNKAQGNAVEAFPITAEEVAGWFNAETKNGKKPRENDCLDLADRLEFHRGSISHFPLMAAVRPRKSKVSYAFESLIYELELEAQLNSTNENLLYATGSRPLSTYSHCLFDILQKVRTHQSFIIDKFKDGISSDLQNLTVDVAGRILGVWNRARGVKTVNIGRASPCESILVLAINRVTGGDYQPDALRSEIARSDQKLLRMLATYKREDWLK